MGCPADPRRTPVRMCRAGRRVAAERDPRHRVARGNPRQPGDQRDPERRRPPGPRRCPTRRPGGRDGGEAGGGAGGEHELVVGPAGTVHDPRLPGGSASARTWFPREPVARRGPAGRAGRPAAAAARTAGRRWGAASRCHDHRDVGLVGEQQLEALLGVGLDDPSRDPGGASLDAAATGGSRAAAAVENPHKRRSPPSSAAAGDDLGADLLPPGEQLVGVAQQGAGGRRQPHRRPSCSSSATPRSRARVRSWWETAEGV